jgi:2-C-methyl-D-erythritol 4-phosphate cytidylyltransferase
MRVRLMDIVKNIKDRVGQAKPAGGARVTAVVVAAGSGERMNSKTKKQFLKLCGIPVIARTLSAFEESRYVSRVVVVTASEDLVDVVDIVREFGFDKVVRIVGGGATRQKSAAAGLEAAGGCDYIAIHDGVRPLVSPKCIDRVIEAAFETKAASAAVKLLDTIKRCDENGFVIDTPDRSGLWSVQTPQVFETVLYRQALKKAEADGCDYTDDCQLVENFGRPVKLVDGEYTNMKLTTRDDMIFAEAILRTRGEA